MTIDSQEFANKYARGSFTPYPMWISCVTIVKYWNQEIGTGVLQRAYLYFNSYAFTYVVCVCFVSATISSLSLTPDTTNLYPSL